MDSTGLENIQKVNFAWALGLGLEHDLTLKAQESVWSPNHCCQVYLLSSLLLDHLLKLELLCYLPPLT